MSVSCNSRLLSSRDARASILLVATCFTYRFDNGMATVDSGSWTLQYAICLQLSVVVSSCWFLQRPSFCFSHGLLRRQAIV